MTACAWFAGMAIVSAGESSLRLTIRDDGGTPEVSIHGPAATPVLLLRSFDLMQPHHDWELVDTVTLDGAPLTYSDDDYTPDYGNVFFVATVAPPPTAVSAVPAADGGGEEIELNWEPPPFPVDYYEIERAGPGEALFESYDEVDSSETSYVDSDVAAGGTFRYRLRAIYAAGWDTAVSAPSQDAAAVLPISPPAGLVATSAGDGTILLEWTPPSMVVDGYVIERSINGQPFVEIDQADGVDTEFVDGDDAVWPGATFTYRMRSVAAGESANSATTSVALPLAAPHNLTLHLTEDPVESFITLNWSQAGLPGEEIVIERAINGGAFAAVSVGELDGTDTTWDDSDIAAGATYEYRVTVSTRYTYRASGRVGMPLPLLAPGLLVVYRNADSVLELWWSHAGLPAEEFIVERSFNGGPFVMLDSLAGDETEFIDDGAVAGATYTYRVSARTIHATVASPTVSYGFAMPAPGGLTAVAVDESAVSLNWNGAPEVAYYVVYRSVGGQPWEESDTVDASFGTSYDDYDLLPGTVVSYLVRGLNEFGDIPLYSGDSNTATATTPVPAPEWADPPLDSSVSARVTLNWDDYLDNEAGHIIFRALGGGGFEQYAVTGPDALSFTDTNTTTATVIRYQVRAYVISGPWHVWSDPTPELKILAAPALTAPANDPNYTKVLSMPVKLDWNGVSGAVKYRVTVWYVHNDGTGDVERVVYKDVTGTSYTPTSGTTSSEIRGGRRYRWRVQAFSADGSVMPGVYSSYRYFRT
jgi:hypothetical protein